MKDIKELIYAAVEENALKFQELVNAQLQVRAYDAIEALRPEVGASMFGESSHKKMDDEEDMEDEDEDEDEMDDKKKSMKEALHPNQQKIDVVDDEKIDAKDFAKLRKMKKEVEQIDEIGDTPAGRAALGKLATARNARARHLSGIAHSERRSAGGRPDATADRFDKMANRDRTVAKKAADKAGVSHSDTNRGNYDYVTKKVSEEAVNEVAMPKNAADWQALITHQIQTTGHPVATDAQFRAQHGKDTSKIASLEPGEDKVHYAAAQGGTVKA
jgi:hypothetical protein